VLTESRELLPVTEEFRFEIPANEVSQEGCTNYMQSVFLNPVDISYGEDADGE
jgi:hypothetical protein